jgi:hypothetical protein
MAFLVPGLKRPAKIGTFQEREEAALAAEKYAFSRLRQSGDAVAELLLPSGRTGVPGCDVHAVGKQPGLTGDRQSQMAVQDPGPGNQQSAKK